ncbi:BZ3500_MvSof-1268-A1-R1_Chr8-2g10185 [Microbotryum saponariae]|uniref:BZ3500_MvSof-1268-A1-R1_Chr8-2g10185 protein n=1 Tax=Microbotryum saponariae TaxID=289078 RepID=A0A2X0MW15_9BASI|nr:BZ3500_MvSof-1268-A1-R1_Chr8-2g10185 [Microbotryum saponariae]SDA01958.1 BZ3501_MvSof-1269-A2-R1_Chr8-2g09935 [Microbotryum saponariae]
MRPWSTSSAVDFFLLPPPLEPPLLSALHKGLRPRRIGVTPTSRCYPTCSILIHMMRLRHNF